MIEKSSETVISQKIKEFASISAKAAKRRKDRGSFNDNDSELSRSWA